MLPISSQLNRFRKESSPSWNRREILDFGQWSEQSGLHPKMTCSMMTSVTKVQSRVKVYPHWNWNCKLISNQGAAQGHLDCLYQNPKLTKTHTYIFRGWESGGHFCGNYGRTDRQTDRQKKNKPPQDISLSIEMNKPPQDISLSIEMNNIEHIRKRSTENLKIKTSEKPLGNLEPFKNLLGEPGTFQEPPSKPPRFLFLSHF